MSDESKAAAGNRAWPVLRHLSVASILLLGAWGPGYLLTWFLMPGPFATFLLSAWLARKRRRLWLQCLVLFCCACAALGVTFLIMFLLIPFTMLFAPLAVALGVIAAIASIPIAYIGAKMLLDEMDARLGNAQPLLRKKLRDYLRW